MPINYNSAKKLVYLPNQTERNQVAAAKRVCQLIQSHGADDAAKEYGDEAVCALEIIEDLQKPKEKPTKKAAAPTESDK